MKRGTWGRKSTTELTTASSRALGDAPAPSSHLKPKPLFYDRRQRGQNAVPDLLDRLKTALADRCAIEREIGAGGMGMKYRISNTEYRDRSVHHHFNIPCSIFSSVFLVQYSIFDILPGA